MTDSRPVVRATSEVILFRPSSTRWQQKFQSLEGIKTGTSLSDSSTLTSRPWCYLCFCHNCVVDIGVVTVVVIFVNVDAASAFAVVVAVAVIFVDIDAASASAFAVFYVIVVVIFVNVDAASAFDVVVAVAVIFVAIDTYCLRCCCCCWLCE